MNAAHPHKGRDLKQHKCVSTEVYCMTWIEHIRNEVKDQKWNSTERYLEYHVVIFQA